ncbi:hypothetical protein L208DRAFT_1325575, partial [Tricholoma matsutake]
PYPDVVTIIKKRLSTLQKSSVRVSLITACAIMLATIIKMKPEILNLTFRDGSKFHASETFIQTWLGSAMEWSQRKAKCTARKIPDDWEDQCERSFF